MEASGGNESRTNTVLRECAAILIMFIGVLSIYWYLPPPGREQMTGDYEELHARRMEFARNALFGERHTLPAWYPRELMGTPFWSNIQSFPFIPTRLALLLLNPRATYTYPLAFNLAAVLAALFTYLFCRRIGLGLTGSAASGFTFACCGFFAARIPVGHLPLLEAFGALSLLLWQLEGLAQAIEQGRRVRLWLATLVISSACVMLAGHPQLPIFAMLSAAVFALARFGIRLRAGWGLAGLAIGGLCASFVLVPAALLVGRSTRVLDLDLPSNHIPMDYARLLGFFLPWREGIPTYESPAYFWDTFCYVGLTPWVAVAVLIIAYFAGRAEPLISPRTRNFLILLAVCGVVLALPATQRISAILPGTLLRSPARWIYLTEFALAIGIGAAVDLLLRGSLAQWGRMLVPAALLLHWIDLRVHDRRFFLDDFKSSPDVAVRIRAALDQVPADGRVGFDFDLPSELSRTRDDVGFFDSLMLARPYRWLIDLSGLPPRLNIQYLDAWRLPARALRAAGVHRVFTMENTAAKLSLADEFGGIRIYALDGAAPRASFFTPQQVQRLAPDAIHALLRDSQFDPEQHLLLTADAPATADGSTGAAVIPVTIDYRRPDSDHIEGTINAPQAGFVRLLESWDPGWTATLDGSPVQVLLAYDALMAIPVPAGRHELRLSYATPGAGAGLTIALITWFLVLPGFIWMAPRAIKPPETA